VLAEGPPAGAPAPAALSTSTSDSGSSLPTAAMSHAGSSSPAAVLVAPPSSETIASPAGPSDAAVGVGPKPPIASKPSRKPPPELLSKPKPSHGAEPPAAAPLPRDLSTATKAAEEHAPVAAAAAAAQEGAHTAAPRPMDEAPRRPLKTPAGPEAAPSASASEMVPAREVADAIFTASQAEVHTAATGPTGPPSLPARPQLLQRVQHQANQPTSRALSDPPAIPAPFSQTQQVRVPKAVPHAGIRVLLFTWWYAGWAMARNFPSPSPGNWLVRR
jgi:hypothetical protein